MQVDVGKDKKGEKTGNKRKRIVAPAGQKESVESPHVDASDKLMITIRSQSGREVKLLVQAETELSGVYYAYAKREGMAPDSYRLYSQDGQRLDATKSVGFYMVPGEQSWLLHSMIIQ